MTLEYLPDVPLIRLFEFTPAEAARFEAAVVRLAAGDVERVDVHALEGVRSVGNCRLTFVVRPWDQAVVRTAGPATFECGFTAAEWDNVAGRIEPLTRGGSGFQWLASLPGEADILISMDGQW